VLKEEKIMLKLKYYYSIYLVVIGFMLTNIVFARADFRVHPYLQNPSPTAMSILWFSETNTAGQLSYAPVGSDAQLTVVSHPAVAAALQYPTWEDTTFFNGAAPAAPFRHRIRLEHLQPATRYTYSVTQGGSSFTAGFKTAPDHNSSIRFVAYADCETEPESTGKPAVWTDPNNEAPRKYLIDQTQGYHNNLAVIRSRKPDLVLIAGDLTQHGGEQRDWDEFWRHNAGRDGHNSLAGNIPILAAPGNHDYYEGPALDRYNQPGSERAISKYLTYFEYPDNQAAHQEQHGRYYSLQYGPATFIMLDLCNNTPAGSADDTNFYLLGEHDAGGGFAPDFNPQSRQYKWLVKQLSAARQNSIFTFVVFHHAPYSSGPHGWPPGKEPQHDRQSGNPTRQLTPLFMEYGVDAVLSGHDEMWERSTISGVEVKLDGSQVKHTIQFYDVGIGGDGLRSPSKDLKNPHQQFLVHNDVPEKWQDGILIDGGKHYGHLEVNIMPVADNIWQAVLEPVYVFPLWDPVEQSYSGYERRVYADQVTLLRTAK